jgi:hypothetical protein
MKEAGQVKHTPGPWHIETGIEGCARCVAEGGRATVGIIGANDRTICYDAYHDSYANLTAADAALIAAAPELLAALKALLAYVEDDNPGAAKADAWVAGLCDAAREAIAKAEGATSGKE